MMTFPLGQNASLCIIEPGNIKRLKRGEPLKVGDHMVVFTPDVHALMRELGIPGKMPERGERIDHAMNITQDQLIAAIIKCKDLPEVDR